MKGYKENIEKLTLENNDFRRVLYTARQSQLVLMTLRPGEEIGDEVHDVDQFFRFESGQGKALLNGMDSHDLRDGDALIIPAGTRHNIINTSPSEPLRLYTLYSPPHHRDGIVHATKVAAEADDEEFAGVTTEELPDGGPGGYWFRAKRFGWGWRPVSWQGWVTTGIYLVLIIDESLSLGKTSSLGNETFVSLSMPFVFITALFIFLCWAKGERPRWRWGK
jgi:mannose-6-phosphate isomerase-like protein (cupin superfamily)